MITQSNSSKYLWTATLLGIVALSPVAVAQTAVVDEVIVTTTRSDSLRIDNAGNIATIDPSETVNLFPVEMLNRAPGVHIHRGSGQEHLTAIRSPVLVGGAGAGSFSLFGRRYSHARTRLCKCQCLDGCHATSRRFGGGGARARLSPIWLQCRARVGQLHFRAA